MPEQHQEKQAAASQPQPQAKPQPTDEPKSSVTKANIILDSLFTQGFYEEEVDLPGGRKCILRTRSTEAVLDIVSRLEAEKIGTAGKYNLRFSLYCLASSLRSMGGKPLPEEFDKKIGVISDLPGPVTEMLIQQLVKFDKAVTDVYTPEEAKN